jgi:hypothetical protein
LLLTAAALFGRHLMWLQDPAAASGGMAAFGDAILYLFLGFLFLIPTVFLIWILAKSEDLYTTYSRVLFCVSLSAPVCLGVVALGENHVAPGLSWLCFYRLLESPIVLVGMGISRLAARFDRAKRLTVYALLIEGLTVALPVAGFIVSLFIHK